MTVTARVSVVRNGTIWTGGPTPRIVHGSDLVIENGLVATIEPNYRGRADVEIDATDCLVTPGFINGHCHPGTTPRSRGLAEDADLPEDGAFYHMTLPTQLHAGHVLSPAEVATVMEWDLIALIAGGATTIVAEQFGPTTAWLQMVERIGFRCHYGFTYPNNLGAIGYVEDGKLTASADANVAGDFRTGLALHDKYHNAHDGRLRIHLSPHGPDTVSTEILVESRREAEKRGVGLHLHLAQHPAERKVVAAKSGGKTSVEYLESIGFLGPDVMATHVTYVEEQDYGILARTGTHVVHASYRKAKEGIASPFWDFLSRGVNVAIATDSFSHDMIGDLRLAAMIGKIRGGRVAHPSAREVLTCATWGAAKALGRPDLGHLNAGARGDVTIVSLATPFNAPVLDPIRALVYYSGAGDIRHTLVDGEILYSNGRIVGTDIDSVRRISMDACHRLWTAAAEGGVMPPGTHYPCSH